MHVNSLAYKTLKNVSYSFMGFFWPLVFSLVITPIIVLKLGPEKYGVFMLIGAISGLMGLFDLGVGSTMVKYISEYEAKGDREKIKDLIYSFNIVLLALAIFGLVILVLIGLGAGIFFPSAEVSSNHYTALFLLSGLIFFFNTLSATYTVVPVALQRFDINTKIGVANITISNVSMLVLVLLGHGLVSIFISQLVIAIMLFFVYRYYSQKLLPEVRLKYRWVRSEIAHVYKFGLVTYASNAANSALTYFDRLLIPVYLGPAALSYYSLPGNITTKTPGLINNIATIVFPMISSLNGLKDMEKIKKIYVRIFNIITVLTFAITISIILFANKILLYWLNLDFAQQSTQVLIILAVTYYFLTLSGTLNSFLLGLTRAKFLFKSSILMACLNISLLFVLVPKFGIIGAAWAYFISVTPIVGMFLCTEHKFLGLTHRTKEYLRLYLKLAIVALIFTVVTKFITLQFVNSLAAVVVAGPLSVVLFLLLYRVLGFFEKEDLDTLRNFAKIVLFKMTSRNTQ